MTHSDHLHGPPRKAPRTGAPRAAALLALCKLAVLLFSLVAGGCWGRDKEATIEIAEDDPELAVSRQNARATINQFIDALENPRAGQTLFAVKAKFVDGDRVEYMWLTDLRYEDGRFTGIVNNEPSVVSNVRMGQEHTVPVNEIDDWMILENDQIVGGYSVEVVARRQSPGAAMR